MDINLNFKKWFTAEMCGTGVVFDPKKKSHDWNVWGSPGSTGVSPVENPIGVKKKKKK